MPLRGLRPATSNLPHYLTNKDFGDAIAALSLLVGLGGVVAGARGRAGRGRGVLPGRWKRGEAARQRPLGLGESELMLVVCCSCGSARLPRQARPGGVG